MENDNELIAKFMGDDKIHPRKRKYSTSWEWLMPVVEKISQRVYDSQEEDDGTGNMRLIEYRAYPRTFGMISTEGKWMVRLNRMPLHEGNTLIEATYKAVVEYVNYVQAN